MMRIESYNAKTSQVDVQFTGDINAEKQERIKDLKERCSVAILKICPVFKQTNAALGIYDKTKTQEIKDNIQAYKNYCDTKETEINAALTCEDVWNVHIDFGNV